MKNKKQFAEKRLVFLDTDVPEDESEKKSQFPTRFDVPAKLKSIQRRKKLLIL